MGDATRTSGDELRFAWADGHHTSGYRRAQQVERRHDEGAVSLVVGEQRSRRTFLLTNAVMQAGAKNTYHNNAGTIRRGRPWVACCGRA